MNHNCTNLHFDGSSKGVLEVAFILGIQNLEIDPKRARSHSGIRQLVLDVGNLERYKHAYCSVLWEQLMQDLQPLRVHHCVEDAHPGHIAARVIEARDKAQSDRIIDSRKNNRYGGRGCFRCHCWRFAASSNDHGD